MVISNREGGPDAQLRVLHVVTRFRHGGSEQRLIDAVSALADARVTIVAGELEGISRLDDALHATPEIIHVPTLRRDPSTADDVATIRSLRRIIRELRPEVVHTHQAKAGLLGRLSAVGLGAEIIHSSSMATFGEGYARLSSIAFRLAEVATSPLVSAYAVVGDDLARRLAGAGIAERKLTVIRSAIDLAPFVAARTALEPPTDGAIRVLFAGSLEERKGVEQLPDFGWALHRATGQHIAIRIAGDGPLRERLTAATAAPPNGVSVQLLGHRHDVADLLASSDLAVLLSSSEGLSQFLVQATAVGVPFAAFAADGTGELLSLGASGVSAPIGDVQSLAAAAARLVAGEPSAPVPPTAFAAWDRSVVHHAYRSMYSEVLGLAVGSLVGSAA